MSQLQERLKTFELSSSLHIVLNQLYSLCRHFFLVSGPAALFVLYSITSVKNGLKCCQHLLPE
eukprot:m.164422 g.164422  ORF g.164422 m.164422 type:complete len:63 (+) comp16408_c0_seq2:1319-1507(+)